MPLVVALAREHQALYPDESVHETRCDTLTHPDDAATAAQRRGRGRRKWVEPTWQHGADDEEEYPMTWPAAYSNTETGERLTCVELRRIILAASE